MIMKRLLYLGFILFCLSNLKAQEYYMVNSEGFGVSVTGNGDVTPVIVTTLGELATQIVAGSPGVILVSGTITIPSKFTYLKPSIPGGSGGSNDHRFTNLMVSNSSDAPADGHFSITL